MHILQKYQSGFVLPVAVATLLVLTVLGLAVYRVASPVSFNQNSEQELPTVSQPESKPPQTGQFSGAMLYDQIQNGMSYNDVKNLAGGRIGDCATTDVYPDSNRMSCAWNDESLGVTVNFINYQVVGKSRN